jgi:hypothetical protein
MNADFSNHLLALKTSEKTLNRLVDSLGAADPQLVEQLRNALLYQQSANHQAKVQNTYLKEFEIPQINLFDILANHFPLVVESQKMAHECVAQALGGKNHICIVDLGIGRSVQMIRLLNRLNEIQSISKITLIGIDIMSAALEHSQQELTDKKSEWEFELDIHLIHDVIETMDFKRISSKIPVDHDYLYVNASLTLHHIQGSDERDLLFKKIKSLSPDLITLIEPNTSTFTNDIELRIERAIEHFYALYKYTDTLPLKEEEKRSLKTFFGNDFFDPIAYADNARFEKLERGEEWIERASKSGFKPFLHKGDVLKKQIDNIDLRIDQACYASFAFKGIDLLSLIYFH